jgi:hypothetical protein
VFRDKSPYTFPGGVANIVLKNAARVAEVWLDEWKEFYFAMSPGTTTTTSFCRIIRRMFVNTNRRIAIHRHILVLLTFINKIKNLARN